MRRQRSVVAKAVKLALPERARGAFEYRILYHASRGDLNAQVADHLSWCVHCRAARADARGFSRGELCVRSVGSLA